MNNHYQWYFKTFLENTFSKMLLCLHLGRYFVVHYVLYKQAKKFFLNKVIIGIKKCRMACWFQKCKLTLGTKCTWKKLWAFKVSEIAFYYTLYTGNVFLSTLIANIFFQVHFVTKVSLHFWNQHEILHLLIPIMTSFKKIFFCLLLSELCMTLWAPR